MLMFMTETEIHQRYPDAPEKLIGHTLFLEQLADTNERIITAYQSGNDILKTDNQTLKGKIKTLEQKIARLAEQKQKLQKQVRSLKQKNQRLQKKLDNLLEAEQPASDNTVEKDDKPPPRTSLALKI